MSRWTNDVRHVCFRFTREQNEIPVRICRRTKRERNILFISPAFDLFYFNTSAAPLTVRYIVCGKRVFNFKLTVKRTGEGARVKEEMRKKSFCLDYTRQIFVIAIACFKNCQRCTHLR